MPRAVRPLSQWSIIADLRRDVDRLRLRSPSQQVVFTHDTFTAAGTPSTTYPLTYLPTDGSVLLAKQGLVLREGTDYTVDGTTGIVTVTASQSSGDQIVFRYATTGELIANNATVETDPLTDDFNRADSATTINNASDGGTWTVGGGTWGISSNHGYLVSNGGGALYGAAFYAIRRNFGFVAQDVTVTSLKGSAGTAQLQVILFAWDPTVASSAYSAYGLWITPDGSSTTVQVYKMMDNGVATKIGANLTGTAYTTSVFRVVYNPATGAIDVYQGGSLLGTRTDGSPLTGTGHTWVGLGQLNASGTEGWDDFNVDTP